MFLCINLCLGSISTSISNPLIHSNVFALSCPCFDIEYATNNSGFVREGARCISAIEQYEKVYTIDCITKKSRNSCNVDIIVQRKDVNHARKVLQSYFADNFYKNDIEIQNMHDQIVQTLLHVCDVCANKISTIAAQMTEQTAKSQKNGTTNIELGKLVCFKYFEKLLCKIEKERWQKTQASCAKNSKTCRYAQTCTQKAVEYMRKKIKFAKTENVARQEMCQHIDEYIDYNCNVNKSTHAVEKYRRSGKNNRKVKVYDFDAKFSGHSYSKKIEAENKHAKNKSTHDQKYKKLAKYSAKHEKNTTRKSRYTTKQIENAKNRFVHDQSAENTINATSCCDQYNKRVCCIKEKLSRNVGTTTHFVAYFVFILLFVRLIW